MPETGSGSPYGPTNPGGRECTHGLGPKTIAASPVGFAGHAPEWESLVQPPESRNGVARKVAALPLLAARHAGWRTEQSPADWEESVRLAGCDT